MSELLTYLLENQKQFRRARLAALYSDFRQLRTLNPDGYDANIEAWRKGLADAARDGQIPTKGSKPNLLAIRVDTELLPALETKEWGRPLALGTVITEAVAKKEMIPVLEYLAAKDSIYQRSWAIRPWAVVSWGLQQLGLTGGQYGDDSLPTGNFVVLSNLEEAAKNFSKRISTHRSRVDRIFSRVMFQKSFADVLENKKRMSDLDMDIFLKFLSRDKRLISYDGHTVKIKGFGEATTLPITTEDTSIASLKSLIADLEIQIHTLSKRVDELGITARDAVARNNKVAAITALRSKKLAESTLTKRSATLGQLEEVFSKIEQAADQVELVRIMEASTRVLSSLNTEVGGVERVDDVVDRLREQMEGVDEVGNVIAEVGQGTTVIDEAEVDDELEAMEREEKEKKQEQERKLKKMREQEEAAETIRKLEELKEVERQIKQAKSNDEQQKEEEARIERGIEESVKGLTDMSLNDDQPAHVPA
ncbi:hypothetical protein B7463_g9731, partial [Scytalidium lignicola]